ncbi:holo-ACP synthase [Bombilactobacillus thymidiniphilus]|uniref:Holo-[acyl-carrier-protein] synthase n=1 Tax=Bombilactobacillus thymidiniphilus TaxID=2923363 RepID=A0ABY4PE26_9LACO|nr:holo-ACP synthase [Bombilactobacillus thymidiniphilus]UQS84034.1 holo-ACP synthase [Bombilactobacillus thymidiniphilus]
MIEGLGVDIAEIERIWQANQKTPRFKEKVLTKDELMVFASLKKQRQKEFLAGRFSAKEAFSKALGTGIGSQVSFLDLSILDSTSGQPKIYQTLYSGRVLVSISHTKCYVMTEVILEKEG